MGDEHYMLVRLTILPIEQVSKQCHSSYFIDHQHHYEVSQVREIVELKKDQDRRQVQLLAGQADSLRQEGEEFAIILPGANMKNALKKGRQICDAVAAARYATSKEQEDDYLSVTVSIGVTDFHEDDSPESIINRADNALYKTKNSGKNRAIGRKS